MRRKWLRLGFYVLVVSLLLLTLSACDEPSPPLSADYMETVEADVAQRQATSAAGTAEVATAIAGVETYEAGAAAEAEVTANAEATANAEGVSVGVCRTPGAWCVVKGQFDELVGYEADSNEVNIFFPADGGAVSGDFHFSWMYEASDDKGYLCRALIGSVGTLSGDFDPESAKLEGTVYDFRSTLDVLECSGGIEVEAYPPTTRWSATYDWSTGGIEGEVVFPDEAVPFRGTTVSEEPSNPAD